MEAQSNSRFVKTTAEDRRKILETVVPENTKKNTKYAVSLFKKWLVENFQDDSFEELTDHNLNELLLVFYPEIRSETGQRLSKSTMVGIRSGISRYLESPPYNRNVCISSNPEFATSNKMFFSVRLKKKEVTQLNTIHPSQLKIWR